MGQLPYLGKRAFQGLPKESTPDRTIAFEVNQSDWIFQNVIHMHRQAVRVWRRAI
jgi:hypothetical protein